MRWRQLEDEPCPIAKTLSVIGDRWTMLILREAFLRARRFGQFQEALGVTRHVLAARIKKLVEDGVLERKLYRRRPNRYEYRLTEKGLDLYPVLLALNGWGMRWKSSGDGPAIRYHHRACGAEAEPVMCCSNCGSELDARDIVPLPGPAAPPLDNPWVQALLKRFQTVPA